MMRDASTSNRSDRFRLDRFLDAQITVYTQAYAELAAGQKRSHWMWYIFPQIQGLGSSPMAQRFGISGLPEARAYLAHDTLGPRLRECTALVIATQNRSVEQIFGYPDHLKFHSSVTLFAEASSPASSTAPPECNAVFTTALSQFFAGKRDLATLSRL